MNTSDQIFDKLLNEMRTEREELFTRERVLPTKADEIKVDIAKNVPGIINDFFDKAQRLALDICQIHLYEPIDEDTVKGMKKLFDACIRLHDIEEIVEDFAIIDAWYDEAKRTMGFDLIVLDQPHGNWFYRPILHFFTTKEKLTSV